VVVPLLIGTQILTPHGSRRINPFLLNMSPFDIVAAFAGALATFLTFFIHRQNGRMDALDVRVNDVRIEVARQQQENKELHTHIERIDKNLDELFKKMEEVLFAVRKNGKN
jgi:hypothetical protein